MFKGHRPPIYCFIGGIEIDNGIIKYGSVNEPLRLVNPLINHIREWILIKSFLSNCLNQEKTAPRSK